MNRWVVPGLIVAAILLIPLVSGPAAAANVPVTLIAYNVEWHVGTHSTPPKPTITVNPGDVLQLRIENHDATGHTFTFPHFTVNDTLAAGSPSAPFVIFVNLTTSTADNGKWQFYCSVLGHTTGTDPNRDGMVGWVQVGASNPPPTPGFEVLFVIAALGIAVVVARVVPRRKK